MVRLSVISKPPSSALRSLPTYSMGLPFLCCSSGVTMLLREQLIYTKYRHISQQYFATFFAIKNSTLALLRNSKFSQLYITLVGRGSVVDGDLRCGLLTS